MKANELRIGNLVKKFTGEQVAIKAIDILCAEETEKLFNSIELTEEWLIKAGFEKEVFNNATWYRKNFFSLSPFFNYCLLDVDGEYIDSLKVKSVNQLQNLYFALTGEELEIKM